MSTEGLYQEEMHFGGKRQSTERTSLERERVKSAIEEGVAGIGEEVRYYSFQMSVMLEICILMVTR